ncbi:MAG TPA: hypothetical protein VGG38_09515 [Acidimicrobiales bacterium]
MTDAARSDDAEAAPDPRPTLDAAVRRRRADQAFFIRLGSAIAQHEKLLARLR